MSRLTRYDEKDIVRSTVSITRTLMGRLTHYGEEDVLSSTIGWLPWWQEGICHLCLIMHPSFFTELQNAFTTHQDIVYVTLGTLLVSIGLHYVRNANRVHELFCLVEGETGAFLVKIQPAATVDELKKAIKIKKRPDFDHFAADSLTLFRVDVLARDLPKALEQIDLPSTGMNPLDELSDYYSDSPPKDTIHILVKRPVRNKRPSPPIAPIQGQPNPVALGVSGTPASGKSTLAQLLAEHIEAEEGIEPTVIIQWPQNPKPETPGPWTERLPYNPEGPNTIIIDEAQLTYWDFGLWNNFLKYITEDSRDRVILFASYGSPTGRVSAERTQMIMSGCNRVSLRPEHHEDGIAPAGLLLTREEFTDMVGRANEAGFFADDFLDYVFRVTAGHTGAVADLLSVVLAHDSYRDLKNKNGKYSLEIFKTQFPIEQLHSCLEDVGVFRRGLPTLLELQEPKNARVFRAVLSNNSVSTEMLEDEEDKKTLENCFKMGWLHATVGQHEIRYIFTTPLHQWFVEYHLGTKVADSTPINQDLPDFAFNVIRLFSRAILSTKRQIVGTSNLQRPPEAQYQDEFYRCCHEYSNGSLISFPEFGNASEKVNFYIPRNRWGVELLRDGDRLENHSSRFTGKGAYAKMNFNNYIILDFRTKKPRDAHPGMPKPYHVVFNDDHRRVRILSGSSLEKVAEFELLNES